MGTYQNWGAPLAEPLRVLLHGENPQNTHKNKQGVVCVLVKVLGAGSHWPPCTPLGMTMK